MQRYPLLVACLLALAAACQQAQTPGDSVAADLDVPAGPQASGPRLSAGAAGTVVMSWMEPDPNGSMLRYSVLGDAGWQPAQTVVSGVDMFVNWADLPSVLPLTNEHWAAHWLENAGSGPHAYRIRVAQSFDGGRTWSPAVTPHTDDTPTEHGFVSLFPIDGALGAIWLDGRKMANANSGDPLDAGMTLRAARIDASGALRDEQVVDELICDCCQTGIAQTELGPVAVFRNRTIGEIRDIHVTRWFDGKWSNDVPLFDDNWEIAGCPVNGPAVAAHGPRVSVAWFTAARREPAVKLGISLDNGLTFDNVIRIASNGALGHVAVVALDDGSAVVSWLERDDGRTAQLVARRVNPDLRPGPVHPIAYKVALRSVPQMARAGTKLVFAWTETREGATTLRSARIDADALPDWQADR